MLKRLEERSGVEHIHPHKFRRTLATNLARRNMPIQTIAAILGHENIETTMQYIVMNKDNTKMQYRQYYAV
jgi:integrase